MGAVCIKQKPPPQTLPHAYMGEGEESDYAAIATPPAMYALIGVQAGPVWLRGLNQLAVNHTCDPAATVDGNATSKIVRVVEP